jgi:tripeptide aminopeptidase
MQQDLVSRMLDLAVAIQQIPAPTFEESERAQTLFKRFLAEELLDVEIDEHGNVFGRYPGRGQASPLVVSAHLDTVFASGTRLTLERKDERICGPGIGDNSTGVAGLFGLLWSLKSNRLHLPGDLWLVANVGEEGLGNLCGMQAVVDRFADQPAAYLVLEGLALGQIYHRALSSERYRITVHANGGHSWVDYGNPSAIHELARLLNALLEIPLPNHPRTTLNAGVIQGGTSINTIAAEANLELDLRSESLPALHELVTQVEQVCQDFHHKGVKINVDLIGRRPGGELDAHHPLVELAQACLQSQGIHPHLNIGSTDANIPLSRSLPAVCIGLTTGGGAHTLDEYINTAPTVKDLAQVVALVEGIYTLPD